MIITTDNPRVNEGIKIALKDIELNTSRFKSGLLEDEKPVLLAGGDYDRPWTRDASINTYNYLAFGMPELAKNTLMAVLDDSDGLRIGGQYWDCVIWAMGAEQYINMTGDESFRKLAVEAVSNTLSIYEKEEYSEEYSLFRGAAVYGDGVSAYPDVYGISGDRGCILDWPGKNPDRAVSPGYGIPMHTLSTNCAYYNAYMMLFRLAGDKDALYKASKLRVFINEHFYYEDGLRYIVGKYGNFSEQEGMGVSLGLLFEVLPDDLVNSVKSTDHGIACVWPGYDRYLKGNDIGRHSGLIWPFINCFWANEAVKRGKTDIFDSEFNGLLEKAIRDDQFYEIYHPVTGQPYGGIQEGSKDKPFYELKSCEHQAWSATGFLSMLLYGVAGIKVDFQGLHISPYLPEDVNSVEIKDLHYRNTILNISILKDAAGPGKAMVASADEGTRNIILKG